MGTLEELADDISNRWKIFKDSDTIVKEKFEDGRALAQDALRTASLTIANLQNAANVLNAIDVSVVLPVLNPPNVGTFTAVAPTPPTIDVNFPAPPSDTDEIEGAVKTKLLHDIQSGGPAIPEDVEDTIFKRDIERSSIALQDEIDRISSEWAKRGFTLPNGFLSAGIDQAVIEFGNKRVDVSRDIAIKSFELGDANTKFAVQQGIAFMLQRINAYTAEVHAEAARIDAIVRKYLGEVDAYKGTAQVFTALVDVNIKEFDAILQEEIARANLLLKNVEVEIKNFEVVNGLKVEAIKAIGSINSQLVAGALSSVSASANISASNSAAYSFNPNQVPTTG